MGWDEVKHVRDDTDKAGMSAGTTLLLVMLATRLHGRGYKIGIARLCKDTGLSARQVKRSMAELRKLGLVETTPGMRSSMIRLCFEVTDDQCQDGPAVDSFSDRMAPHEVTGWPHGGDRMAPLRKGSKKGSREEEPPVPPGPTFSELESMCLECIPATRRRGAFALDGMSARKLQGLVEKHGLTRCMEAIQDCGAAERPVAMLAKRLGAKEVGGGPAPHAAQWEQDQRAAGHSTPWVDTLEKSVPMTDEEINAIGGWDKVPKR